MGPSLERVCVAPARRDATGGTDFTFMRTLRILKLARVLRGLRVMRPAAERLWPRTRLRGLRAQGMTTE